MNCLKIKVILCCAIVLLSFAQSVQCQQLLRLNSYFGSSDHLAKANLFSESGSEYFIGEFTGELIIGMNNLNSDLRRAVYIGKQGSEGQIPFLSSITGSGALFASALAVRGDSLIVVGTFSDSLFTQNDTIVNEGFKAGYMVIFDTLGKCIDSWYLPSYSSELFDVNFSSDGDILLCGEFYNKMIINQQTYSANLGFNSFLIKLHSKDLHPYWVRISEGTATNARVVGSDKIGNIYITGSYGNGTLFNGQMLPEVKGDHNMFVASYSGEGELIWIKSITSPVQIHGLSQHVLDDGTVYVGGEFEFTLDLDETVAYNSLGLMDGFIAKFDKQGILHWSGVISGKDNDKTTDITADAIGNPILLVNGGELTYSSLPINTEGFRSPALLKLNKETGELMWQYRIPAVKATGIAEGYAVDWRDGYIAICGTNRTGLFYMGEILDSPNNDDSFRALVKDTLYINSLASSSENFIDPLIELYPNPASSGFVLRSPVNNLILGIEIYDSQATLLKQLRLNDEYVELNNSIQGGIYHLRITTISGVYNRRLIIL